MEKDILIQYSSLKQECQDIQVDIKKLEARVKRLESGHFQVADSVKGTRCDGTYGSIRITGIPITYYERQKELLGKRIDKLSEFECRLSEMIVDVENYVNSLADSRMRRLLRYKYLDDLSWVQVAHRMGKKYSADSCRNAVDRFFGKR